MGEPYARFDEGEQGNGFGQIAGSAAILLSALHNGGLNSRPSRLTFASRFSAKSLSLPPPLRGATAFCDMLFQCNTARAEQQKKVARTAEAAFQKGFRLAF
jgi:hypothetical protein